LLTYGCLRYTTLNFKSKVGKSNVAKTLDIYIRAHGAKKQSKASVDIRDKQFGISQMFRQEFRVIFYWKHADVVAQRATDWEILKAILRTLKIQERKELVSESPELVERFCRTQGLAFEELNNIELQANFAAISDETALGTTHNYKITWDDSMPERLILIGSDANIQILRKEDQQIDYWPSDLRSLMDLIMGNMQALSAHCGGNMYHPLRNAAQYYDHINLHWTICRGDFQNQGNCILDDKTLQNPTECLEKVCAKLNKPQSILRTKTSRPKKEIKKRRYCGWFS
jgi:hypothetical protein